MRPRIKNKSDFQLVNKPSWISPHEVLQSWLLVKNEKGKARGVKREGGLLTFFPWKGGGGAYQRGGLTRGFTVQVRGMDPSRQMKP